MKGVIYARYSSEKQTEQSIEGQIRVCKEYCKRNGIQVVGIYIDRAVSASKDIENRVEFLRMIKDSERRKWDCVIVYKLDRFARNRYDSAIYKNKLKKNGVKVISATENISDSPEGIILESVLEGMAEFYSKELSQKVLRGMKESALKAQSTGGTVPLGYKIKNKKLVIDEKYAPVVRMIFRMYADGFTISQIVKKLNEQGYRTRKGKPFTKNSFSGLLSNKKYIGIYTYNNEVEIEGGVPALIDKETFDKVQARREKNKKASARGKALVDYLLTGKLYCGECGSLMAGESTKKGDVRYHYYSCSNRKRFKKCKKKNLRKDDIESLVVKITSEKVLTERNINLIADVVIKELEKDKENNITLLSLKNEKKEIEKAINNLLKLVEQGAVSETLSKRLNELEEQKSAIEHRIVQEEKGTVNLTKDHIVFWLHEFKKGDIKDMGYKRHLIDMLVNSVVVADETNGDQKIIIAYNLSQEEVSEYRLSDLINSSDMSIMVGHQQSYPNFFTAGTVFGITINHRF